MTDTISRRGLLHIGAGTAAVLGISTLTGELGPVSALSQSGAPNAAKPTVQVDSGVQLFYREDFFGLPWLKPEPVLMIHGVGESGITWYGWVPRMGQEFRLLRPDLPGFGQSTAPANFEWTLPNFAKVFAQFLDAMEVESAHVIGAKVGGAIAMQFAADYPRRTRTLVLASAPISEPKFASTTAKVLEPKWVRDTQRDRLGSAASNEQVDYWISMMNATNPATTVGINKVTAALNLEPVLPRIAAPTLVITADHSSLQSVETVLRYQQKIPKSRLLVLRSDAYHVAVAKADECVANVLSFIKEAKA
jgi:3-oxoadipate enol-lactonase